MNIDLPLSLQCLAACELSYLNIHDIPKSPFYEQSGLREIEQFTTRDGLYSCIHGYLSDGRGMVAFRGTQPTSLLEWMTDLDAEMLSISGCDIHRGFYEALLQLEIDCGIHAHDVNIVTGHSLGAAIGEIYAMTWSIDTAITFGSPKPANAVFADRFDEAVTCTNYQNHGDPICNLPLTLPGFPYEHVGNVVTIGEQCLVDEIERHYLAAYRVSLESLLQPV